MNLRGVSVFAAVCGMACQSRTAAVSSDSLSRADAWSEEAAITLLSLGVQHTDPSIRAAAVAHWIASKHPSSHRLVPWVMADPSPHVQRAAARIVTPTTARPVVHAGTDPIAQVMLEETNNASMWMVSTLAAIKDGFPPLDPVALELVIQWRPEGAAETIVRGVDVADESMRLPLALAAVRMDAEGAHQALTTALQDADDEMRIAAIEGLVYAPVDRSRGWLERAAKRSESATALHARLALMALGERPISVGIDALSSPARDTRAWALECLQKRAEEQPLPREVIVQVQGSLRDESPLVRGAAVRALIAAAGVEYVPLRAEIFEAEPDAVSMLIAGKWLAHTLNKAVE